MFLFVVLYSCTKVDKGLGYDMIPDSQRRQLKLYTTSAFTLTTERIDSLRTNNAYRLGRVDDPRLGKSKIGFAAQFRPYYDYGYEFPRDTITFDSAYLSLQFYHTSFVSGGSEPMEVEVYEIKTLLDSGKNYYGISKMGEPSIIENYVDMGTPVSVTGVTINDRDTLVRIKLSDDVVRKLYNARTVTSLEEFLEQFKGLYVTVKDGNGGCIKAIDLLSTSSTGLTSRINVFYSFKDTVENEETGDLEVVDSTYLFPYYISSVDPNFGIIQHDYTFPLNNDVVYIQGMYGVAPKLEFNEDSIKEWKGKKINRADLILSVEDADWETLNFYADSLATWTKDDGSYYATKDLEISVSLGARPPGVLNRTLKVYSVNITSSFHKIIKGTMENNILMFPYYPLRASSSAIQNKRNNSAQPQLRITYEE
jgi:hypothetical protein